MAGFVEILPKQYFDGFISATMYTNVVDAGNSAGVVIQAVLDATTSGSFTLQPQHSNVNEENTFINLGSSFSVGSAITDLADYSQFGRYLRVRVVSAGGASGYLRVLMLLKDSN